MKTITEHCISKSEKNMKDIMPIDFKATQNSNDNIEYLNQSGDIVKTYPIKDLDAFVYGHALNVKTVNPANTDDGETTEVSVEDWIDANWFYACELFWNDRNK